MGAVCEPRCKKGLWGPPCCGRKRLAVLIRISRIPESIHRMYVTVDTYNPTLLLPDTLGSILFFVYQRY